MFKFCPSSAPPDALAHDGQKDLSEIGCSCQHRGGDRGGGDRRGSQDRGWKEGWMQQECKA
eukprot:1139485-Pelagomonas_calceolata.AAC.18